MDRKKNIFDMIGTVIPGYTGYAKREGRRNCDKILRDRIVTNLSAIEAGLYERIKFALSLKDLTLANGLEENRKKINTLSSKVKYAPHGETAFFSDKQIKEDKLLQIYQIDFELTKVIDNLRGHINDIGLTELESQITQGHAINDMRDNLVNQFK